MLRNHVFELPRLRNLDPKEEDRWMIQCSNIREATLDWESRSLHLLQSDCSHLSSGKVHEHPCEKPKAKQVEWSKLSIIHPRSPDFLCIGDRPLTHAPTSSMLY